MTKNDNYCRPETLIGQMKIFLNVWQNIYYKWQKCILIIMNAADFRQNKKTTNVAQKYDSVC